MAVKIKCIVVEDEPLAMERTCGYVQKLPFLQLAATFDNATDAIIYLTAEKVDLIFLDINMGGLTGIEMLENIKVNSHVVMTTAYGQYALKGYDLNVTDYLLKPFSFERFVQAIEKVQATMARVSAADRKFIFIKTENRLEKVMLDDILYIEGMRDYRCIYTNSKRIMTLTSFIELENEIPQSVICRVHKSYMVALDKIESIERDRIKIANQLIPISETYKKTLMECIGGMMNQ